MQIKEMYLPWAVDGKWGIEIADGKFKDTVIQIENIEFKDKDSEELLVDYHMINVPEGVIESDYKTNEFFKNSIRPSKNCYFSNLLIHNLI